MRQKQQKQGLHLDYLILRRDPLKQHCIIFEQLENFFFFLAAALFWLKNQFWLKYADISKVSVPVKPITEPDR